MLLLCITLPSAFPIAFQAAQFLEVAVVAPVAVAWSELLGFDAMRYPGQRRAEKMPEGVLVVAHGKERAVAQVIQDDLFHGLPEELLGSIGIKNQLQIALQAVAGGFSLAGLVVHDDEALCALVNAVDDPAEPACLS